MDNKEADNISRQRSLSETEADGERMQFQAWVVAGILVVANVLME